MKCKKKKLGVSNRAVAEVETNPSVKMGVGGSTPKIIIDKFINNILLILHTCKDRNSVRVNSRKSVN